MRVAAGNENGTIEQQESNRMIQPRDSGRGKLCPACSHCLGRLVKEGGKGWVGSKLESLSTAVGTIKPEDGSVRKQDTLHHTASLGHRIHLPGRVCILGGNNTAARISRGSNILISTTTTDHDLGAPSVGAGERKHDTTTSVGICAENSRQVRHLAGDGVGINVKDLR